MGRESSFPSRGIGASLLSGHDVRASVYGHRGVYLGPCGATATGWPDLLGLGRWDGAFLRDVHGKLQGRVRKLEVQGVLDGQIWLRSQIWRQCPGLIRRGWGDGAP